MFNANIVMAVLNSGRMMRSSDHNVVKKWVADEAESFRSCVSVNKMELEQCAIKIPIIEDTHSDTPRESTRERVTCRLPSPLSSCEHRRRRGSL